MKVQLDKFSSNTLSVSGELISSIFVLKKRPQIRTSFQWPLGTKIIVPSPQSLIPLTSNCFCYFFDWVAISDIHSGIGYLFRTKFLGLGRNRNPCGAHPRMNL